MAEVVFAMPDLGEGLEEGEIVAWLVATGDEVTLNQPLVEVETAKATVEIPSPRAGRIASLHGAVGDAVPVGAALVTFLTAEDADGYAGDLRRTPVEPAISTAKSAATPAVRKLAKERGIDLATVTGTGPGGRITVEDLNAAGGWVTDVVGVEPITPIRREIAKRLTEVAAIPQVTTFRTVDCTELDAFRRDLDVSPLPVFVAALAVTCADHPLINASWQADGIHVGRSVHVGIAIDTERGLMVPVLRNTHAMGIAGIGGEIRRLAEAARGGHLTPNDLHGATIGVSNTAATGPRPGPRSSIRATRSRSRWA